MSQIYAVSQEILFCVQEAGKIKEPCSTLSKIVRMSNLNKFQLKNKQSIMVIKIWLYHFAIIAMFVGNSSKKRNKFRSTSEFTQKGKLILVNIVPKVSGQEEDSFLIKEFINKLRRKLQRKRMYAEIVTLQL